MFTLTFTPEPAYDALTDGRWRSDRSHAAVLHRNAVSADFRGTGMADLLMQEVERLAREGGAHAVRVDTHRHNGAQKKLLERHGYRFCGNILCDEPGHDPRRQAFEKLLK
ncbi:MAG: GNAT family N-acetyltransferase [Clostridiales bacterium]|nr:GNAT family N-acetyltransferase [Clostridiales bacterium]